MRAALAIAAAVVLIAAVVLAVVPLGDDGTDRAEAEAFTRQLLERTRPTQRIDDVRCVRDGDDWRCSFRADGARCSGTVAGGDHPEGSFIC